jgi:hypothetical protein
MDLSTVNQKIYDGRYPDLPSFKADIDLIWANCVTYNGLGSELRRASMRIKGEFDDLWNIHTAVPDATVALEMLERMLECQRICDDDLAVNSRGMQIFRTPDYVKLKKQQIDRVQHPLKIETEADDKPTFTPPSDEVLNAPLNTSERYDLAVAINLLPPELLGPVVEILTKALDLKRDQEYDIPFSSLDPPTLRTIEAYVRQFRTKDQVVRRMFQSDTIAAEKQIEIIHEEQAKIKKRLDEKHTQTSASEYTSDNESSDESSSADSGSGSGSGSGSED